VLIQNDSRSEFGIFARSVRDNCCTGAVDASPACVAMLIVFLASKEVHEASHSHQRIDKWLEELIRDSVIFSLKLEF